MPANIPIKAEPELHSAVAARENVTIPGIWSLLIRKEKPTSDKEAAEKTKLSPAAVVKIHLVGVEAGKPLILFRQDDHSKI
jgi:hypothetical protein